MRSRINELLTIARLPACLWTPIHGGREHFDNPGSSVMSFCARYLGAEYSDIPDELVESIQQCKDFSTKREHIAVVLEFLEVKASVMAGEVNGLGPDRSKQVFREFSEVVRLNQEVKRLAASFEVNGTMPVKLDASSQVYPTFSQAIIELKWACDFLEEALNRLKAPPPA